MSLLEDIVLRLSKPCKTYPDLQNLGTLRIIFPQNILKPGHLDQTLVKLGPFSIHGATFAL